MAIVRREVQQRKFGKIQQPHRLEWTAANEPPLSKKKPPQGQEGKKEKKEREAADLARVKAVDEVKAKVALQPDHVRVGSMNHLENGRVRKARVQPPQLAPQRKRVDEIVGLTRRNLPDDIPK